MSLAYLRYTLLSKETYNGHTLKRVLNHLSPPCVTRVRSVRRVRSVSSVRIVSSASSASSVSSVSDVRE